MKTRWKRVSSAERLVGFGLIQIKLSSYIKPKAYGLMPACIFKINPLKLDPQ